MNIKKTITMFLVLSFLISLTFASSDATFTKAVKPSLVLTAADVATIEEAIDNKFKKLSKRDKSKLIEFLKDYLAAVEQEKKKKKTKPALGPKGSKSKN